MDVHGDDAAQLLAALGDKPAYVLGSSGGAQIGLNLAARYPARVHTLVAHEPPCVELLPDAAEQRAFIEDVYNTYREDGVGAAMQKFWVGAGLGTGPQADQTTPQSPEMEEGFGRIMNNLDFFLAHGVKPISRYIPDVATLRAGSARVVVGVGEASTGQLAHRAAVALAERLGATQATFPGDHGGYGGQPAAFAERLHQVLLEPQQKEKKVAAGRSAATEPGERELVITRVFDAPRHIVWKAWTDPEHLMRWWGPRGFKTRVSKMDVRSGGGWRFCMRSPQGVEEWQQGVYREIVEPERLVFSYAFEDETGKPGHETRVTVSFADLGGKTQITLHHAVFETVAVRDDHVQGWNEALDRLAAYAPNA